MNIRILIRTLLRIVAILFLVLAFTPAFAAPFTDNGDFTVTDAKTGLIWQQCSAGFSGASCATGSSTTFTWQNALAYCNTLSLAGKSWRLPNINELKSIVDRGKTSPAIDTTVFPATPLNIFWSSTTDINTSTSNGNAWIVVFSDGSSPNNASIKSSSYTVRCVSGP